MSNNSEQGALESLVNSISSLYNMEMFNRRDAAALSSFTDFVCQNETEISKFGKSTGELRDFMKGFDFTKGFQFDSMRQKLETLHPLRLKLVKMGDEVKKLSVFPDRYGSKKAVEVCRGLVMTCLERMKLDEVSKVSDLVDANTGKLLELQKKFASDDYIKDQIIEVINSGKEALDRLKAYSSELQRYVDGFPHSGEDNLAVVRKRVETANEFFSLMILTDKEFEKIKGNYDRYSKGETVNYYYHTLIPEIENKMVFANVEELKRKLNASIKAARQVDAEFNQETRELELVYEELLEENKDIWEEDNERLRRTIDDLMDRNPRHVAYNIADIKKQLSDVKVYREKCIKDMINNYSWLKKDTYRERHVRLVSNYIPYSYYKSKVEELRQERRKNIWGNIGSALVYIVTIPFLMIGMFLKFVFSVIFGSKDD